MNTPLTSPSCFRRGTLGLLALGLMLLAGRAAALPNVVLILADDLGYGDTELYGNAVVSTPAIDSIATGGVLFTQGYAACPECLPSRASLLVSRHPMRMGMLNNTVGVDHWSDMPSGETIAALLKTKGYQTCAIGKWHLGQDTSEQPAARGFDDYFGFLGGKNSYYRTNAPSNAVHLAANGNVLFGGTIAVGAGQAIMRNGAAVIENAHLTDAFTREALDYIDAHAGGAQPFFMYLAYNAPHDPYQCPKSYYDKYPGITDGKKRIYAGMIDQLNESVGDVLAKLVSEGIANNTIVIFASDNGAPRGANLPGVNAPLRNGKYTVWEGGVRIPFAIKWPGVYSAGQVYSRPVSLMDILPTLCVMAGFTQDNLVENHGIDGVDLTPLLTSGLTEDNFNDGNMNGWTQYNGSWGVSAGKLNFSPGASQGKLMIDNTDPGDFCVETDLTLTSGAAGLVFSAGNLSGGLNAHTGYRVFLESATNRLKIVRVDNGSATMLGSAAVTVASGSTHRLRVAVEGGLIQAYVDDLAVPRLIAFDTTYRHGRLGVCALNTSTAAMFDNVLITQHDSYYWVYESEGSAVTLRSAVRDGDFKYVTIDDLHGNVDESLHDLSTDLSESNNLVDDSAYSAVLERMRDIMTAKQMEIVMDTDGDGLADDWENAHFGGLAMAGALDDYDGDGVPNLLEYALDRDPTRSDRSPDVELGFEGDAMKLSYVRQIDRTGLIYAIEASDNLIHWLPGAGYFEQLSVTSVGKHRERVVLQDVDTLTDYGQRFVRLSVSRARGTVR